MARQRLCKVCGGWHDLDAPWPEECREHSVSKQAKGLKIPMVNFDSMDAVKSMTNGLYYDSKSALRSEYKRAGVIEVGNDVPTKRPAPTTAEKETTKAARRAAVGKALSKVGLGAP